MLGTVGVILVAVRAALKAIDDVTNLNYILIYIINIEKVKEKDKNRV